MTDDQAATEHGAGEAEGWPGVPGGFDDVTAAWLEAALRAGAIPGAGGGLPVTVAAVDVRPLGATVGFLGDLARVAVTYSDGDGPPTVIVKLPTADPGGHQVGSMLRAWAREVAFYRQVAPASPGARVPRCWHSGTDEAAGRWVLVLEDVPSTVIDTERGATGAQATAAVSALARFHAAWWNDGADPSAPRFTWMPGFDTTGVGGLAPLWAEAHPRFLERYGHVVPSPTDRWLLELAGWLGPWSARAADEPLTVVHADYRLDNLLISGTSVTMIDWQTALRGPGTMDLTSFVATALAVEDRRAWEEDLIDGYARGLTAQGHPVDRAWLNRSYDENLLWWMGQFANNLSRLAPDDPVARQALDTMVERTFTAALDRRCGRLLP